MSESLQPQFDEMFDLLRRVVEKHPHLAEQGVAITRAFGHYNDLQNMARAMLDAGCSADQIKVIAFRQCALAMYEIREWQRDHEPARLAHDTQ